MSATETAAYQYGHNKAHEVAANAKQTSHEVVTNPRETFASFRQGGGMVERIAGGVMAVAIVAIVLNELFTLQIVDNTSGPFSGLMDTVESVGTGAITLVILGFLAAAGGMAISMFRGGF